MEADTPGPASPPDPQPDQPGNTVPRNLTVLLDAVGVLLGYGRHLLATIRHRAAAPHFTTIAASFGTANLSTILAHLNRGILRATALERVMLARAATGREMNIPPPRSHAAETQPAPADIRSEPPAERPAAPKRSPRPSRPSSCNDPELFIRTLEELERQGRRRALGRTIAEICLDLGVMPGLCTGAFWNELFGFMHYPGEGVVTVMREKQRREQAFAQQQDRYPTALGLVAIETRFRPPGTGLLHRPSTGRSILPHRGTGHRPALTHRSLTRGGPRGRTTTASPAILIRASAALSVISGDINRSTA